MPSRAAQAIQTAMQSAHAMDGDNEADFLAFALAQQPRVNACLAAELEGLPPSVKPVAEQVLAGGGKRLRPILTLLTARCLGHPAGDDLLPLAASLEFLHSATLLHDDILDQALTRRGRPAAHTLFGVSRTVLAGDVLLALANHIVARHGDARMTACVARAIMETAAGEVEEIANVGNTDLTRRAYLDIVTGKTACLIRAACELGALAALGQKGDRGDGDQALEAAAAFGLNVGVAFQLVDDALDYAACAKALGKPVGGDLREGKMTLPLILYLEGVERDEAQDIKRAMAQNALDPARAAELAARVRESGAGEAARQEALAYAEAARLALERLPAGKDNDLLATAVDFIVARDH